MERVRRRWWTAAVTLATVVVVLGAVVTASFQLVMMVAPGYRQQLADYVSRVAKQPVEIGGVSLGWRGLAPRLDLTDIILYGEDGQTPALIAERLRLGFGATRLLRGDTTPTRIEVSGAELFAQIDAEGKFSLRGIDTAGGPSRATQDWLRQLGRFRSVRLSRCELLLDDARLQGVMPRFRLVDAEVEFSEGRGQATAELELPAAIGSGVQLEAEIAGDLERPETWSGRWSAQLENLTGLPWIDARLAPGAALGFVDTQLHLGGVLAEGKPGPVDLKLEAAQVVGRKDAHQVQLGDIALSARWSPHPQGWELDIDQFGVTGAAGPWPPTRATLRLDREAEGSRFEAEAGYLRIADLAPWLELFPRDAEAANVRALVGAAGAVRGLVLRWQPGAAGLRYSARADVENLSLAGGSESLGFEGLSGMLSASENGGRLRLVPAPLTLRAPKVFTSEVAFDRVSGDVAWSRSGEGWDVQIPRFGAQLAGAKGEGAFKLSVPRAAGQSPRLDLDVRFSAGDATRFKRYIPRFWPATLRNWLDTAVVAGRVPSAHLKIQGELAHFPFAEHPGTFALDLDAADAKLNYAPNWPGLEQLSAHLEFRGMKLAVRGDAALLMGNAVENVDVLIPDLRQGQLSITGETQGEASRYYDFLRASPLATRLSGFLTRTNGRGEAAVQIELQIPLKQARDTKVSGTVRLNGAQLEATGLSEPVVDIRGEVAFDNTGASAQGLSGELFATPVQASIGAEGAAGLMLRAQFDLMPEKAGAGLNGLVPQFLRAGMSGSSHWDLALPLMGPQAGRLQLRSDLRGLALNLPQPLKKPPEEVWPIQIGLDSDPAFPIRVSIELAERLGVNLAMAREPDGKLRLQRARLRAGPGITPHAGADGVFITGSVADLEPLLWIKALGANRSAPASGVSSALPLTADLMAQRLWLGAQNLEDVRVSHAPATGGWMTRLAGKGTQGELSLRRGDEGDVLTGRFERVHVAPRRERAAQDAAAKAEDQPAVAAREPIDPGALPRLDLRVEHLRIAKAEFGRFELRTARITDGQRIEVLRAKGPGGDVDARGEWRRSGGSSSAQLQFGVDSNAIDQVLSGLGYAPNLSAKRSSFKGELNWPPSAAAQGGLDVKSATGNLRIDIDKGQLRAVEPGAGRVLGLINFWALPRRLTLDFRDVLSEGLSFDRIKGRFDIAGGNATTDNLDITAPSLKMEVRGRVGLAARDYDQRVTVYPDVSSGITLGALLLGGPVAGVLALIAQEVLEQPLDQVGQLSYRLTGGWDDPQVVRQGGLIPGLGKNRDKNPELESTPKIPAQGAPPT